MEVGKTFTFSIGPQADPHPGSSLGNPLGDFLNTLFGGKVWRNSILVPLLGNEGARGWS